MQRVDALQSADRSAPFRSKLRRTGTSDLFQTCFKHSRQQACNAVRHHNSPIGPPCPAQACGALRIGHSTTTTTTTHHHHLAHNHTASLLVGTASHTLCSGGCKESGGCCAGFVKPPSLLAYGVDTPRTTHTASSIQTPSQKQCQASWRVNARVQGSCRLRPPRAASSNHPCEAAKTNRRCSSFIARSSGDTKCARARADQTA